jgi:hypothetical protein
MHYRCYIVLSQEVLDLNRPVCWSIVVKEEPDVGSPIFGAFPSTWNPKATKDINVHFFLFTVWITVNYTTEFRKRFEVTIRKPSLFIHKMSEIFPVFAVFKKYLHILLNSSANLVKPYITLPVSQYMSTVSFLSSPWFYPHADASIFICVVTNISDIREFNL